MNIMKKAFIILLITGIGLFIFSFIVNTCNDLTSDMFGINKASCYISRLLKKTSIFLLSVDLIIGIGIYLYNKNE